LAISVKKGPYGHYVQCGTDNGELKPKRVALPRSIKPADVDLDIALRLLALPRELGRHPETGDAIVAGIGRFGPYIKHGTTFKSLAADDDVLTIGLNRAVVLLAEPAGQRRSGPRLLRELGEHPDGGTVAVYAGRYGPYVSHDGVLASLPRTADPATFSLDQAVPLLTVQRQKGKGRQRKSGKSTAATAKPRKVAKAGSGPKKAGPREPRSRSKAPAG
jgi:DNA topoisomerase-1